MTRNFSGLFMLFGLFVVVLLAAGCSGGASTQADAPPTVIPPVESTPTMVAAARLNSSPQAAEAAEAEADILSYRTAPILLLQYRHLSYTLFP